MEKTIFLTGITGFLGTHLVKQLLSNPEVKIIGLIRAADSDSALQRLKKEWWDWPELRAALGSRVLTLAGDITQPRLALNEQDYAFLVENVSHIIHAAADVRLFLALEDLRSVNVTGTLNVLAFAGDVQKQHGLAAFAHVSTAYVAGQRNGEIMEERLSSKSGFTSPYEQSKFEAEELVWQAADQLPVCIFRPGMIVGDSQTGVIKTFNTLYYPLRLYMTGKLRFAPASAGFPVNLVPVDYVASAIFTLMMNPEAIGKVFHLTPAFNDQPTLSEMTIFVRQWAEANLNIHLHRAVFFDLPGFSKLLSWLARISKSKDLAVMATLMPYFQKEPLFNRTNTDQLLGVYPHRWRELLPVLLKEAVYRSFWHRTTRTVHEQVLFRMQSKNKPVTYYDLSLGQVNRRSAAEMLAEIKNIQSAFRAFNINPGERIAIVGLNSSRYFSIFMACGLSGLISTPFYSTCPPSEINKLLADSQPSLLFIGVPELLKRLNEIIYDGPIVSFCRQEPDSFPVKNAMNWHTFINRQAEHYSNPVLYQVNLDDPVSLHYTSGTTGLQKGVLYHHHHYRWLAETLASMFPWFERNRGGSYLSYLPMNHVVEGILATYSPYYVPAKLDLYFLEEFKDLQWALQKVKPTIFFSVPRFFEKVRASFLENKLARYYMSLSEGFVRRLCRRLLQHGLLQKTGLDRCRQIIVGSATSDAALLGFYKDLGIEVH
ncbi:MAG: SDR family oxidoreductase, partial [Anaerolineae bacterium]|nr:SDR family oxidoreductase [Anaerolineae bacterium]